MVHAVEKSLADLGDKVSGEERAKVESALSDLKGVLKGDDKDKIEKKLEALAQASSKVAEQAYAQAGGADGAARRGCVGRRRGRCGRARRRRQRRGRGIRGSEGQGPQGFLSPSPGRRSKTMTARRASGAPFRMQGTNGQARLLQGS